MQKPDVQSPSSYVRLPCQEGFDPDEAAREFLADEGFSDEAITMNRVSLVAGFLMGAETELVNKDRYAKSPQIVKVADKIAVLLSQKINAKIVTDMYMTSSEDRAREIVNQFMRPAGRKRHP
jgi:hypothetical protein